MKLTLVPVRGSRIKRMYARRKLILVPPENLCAVTPATREQNSGNVRDASGAQDQNINTTREAKTHSGGKYTKK